MLSFVNAYDTKVTHLLELNMESQDIPKAPQTISDDSERDIVRNRSPANTATRAVVLLAVVAAALGLALGLGLGLSLRSLSGGGGGYDDNSAASGTSSASGSSASGSSTSASSSASTTAPPLTRPTATSLPWKYDTSNYILSKNFNVTSEPTTRHYDFTISQIQGAPDGTISPWRLVKRMDHEANS